MPNFTQTTRTCGKKKESQECFSQGSRKRLALCCGSSSSKSLVRVPILVVPKSGICGLGIPVPVSVFATSIQNGFFFPARLASSTLQVNFGSNSWLPRPQIWLVFLQGKNREWVCPWNEDMNSQNSPIDSSSLLV